MIKFMLTLKGHLQQNVSNLTIRFRQMVKCKTVLKFNGRKINLWNTNKFSKELHTAVSIVFNVPSSVQSKK